MFNDILTLFIKKKWSDGGDTHDKKSIAGVTYYGT